VSGSSRVFRSSKFSHVERGLPLQAFETAALMLGSDRSRGYCPESWGNPTFLYTALYTAELEDIVRISSTSRLIGTSLRPSGVLLSGTKINRFSRSRFSTCKTTPDNFNAA